MLNPLLLLSHLLRTNVAFIFITLYSNAGTHKSTVHAMTHNYRPTLAHCSSAYYMEHRNEYRYG